MNYNFETSLTVCVCFRFSNFVCKMCLTLGFPWVPCATMGELFTRIGFYPEIIRPNDIACGFYIALQSQGNT